MINMICFGSVRHTLVLALSEQAVMHAFWSLEGVVGWPSIA